MPEPGLDRFLLRLLPPSLRDEYGREIASILADLRAEKGGRLGLRAGGRLLIDIAAASAREHALTVGDAVISRPRYLVASAAAACLLLVPFAVALALIPLGLQHGLETTWLWSPPILGLWAVRFPQIAFAIAAATVLVWLARGGTPDRRRAGIRLLRTAWPLVASGLISLAFLCLLLFHDTAPCVTAQPARALTHPSSAISCIAGHAAWRLFS